MTPKEKAEKLVDKFSPHSYCGACEEDDERMRDYHSKQCAIIAVDEIINTLNKDIRDIDVVGNILLDLIEYWQEVKQEIEKL